MSEEIVRPAWSQHFTPEAIQELLSQGPFAKIIPEWAWGNSTGKGVRVAVVDSGIEYDHPVLENSVRGGVIVEYDAKSENQYRIKTESKSVDVSGHGTACAGIIHRSRGRALQRARARTEHGRPRHPVCCRPGLDDRK